MERGSPCPTHFDFFILFYFHSPLWLKQSPDRQQQQDALLGPADSDVGGQRPRGGLGEGGTGDGKEDGVHGDAMPNVREANTKRTLCDSRQIQQHWPSWADVVRRICVCDVLTVQFEQRPPPLKLCSDKSASSRLDLMATSQEAF